MRIDIESPADAARFLQSGLDGREEVVVCADLTLPVAPVLRDGSHLVVSRGATLTLPHGTSIAKPADVERIDGAMITGGGWIKGGLDLRGVTGFHGEAIRLDTTGDPAFDDVASLRAGALGYYAKIFGLHVSARRKALSLEAGANQFKLYGADLHVSEPGSEAITATCTPSVGLTGVKLDGVMVEGKSGRALVVTGPATGKQVQIEAGVACEFFMKDAAGKEIVPASPNRLAHITGRARVLFPDDPVADCRGDWVAGRMPIAYDANTAYVVVAGNPTAKAHHPYGPAAANGGASYGVDFL